MPRLHVSFLGAGILCSDCMSADRGLARATLRFRIALRSLRVAQRWLGRVYVGGVSRDQCSLHCEISVLLWPWAAPFQEGKNDVSCRAWFGTIRCYATRMIEQGWRRYTRHEYDVGCVPLACGTPVANRRPYLLRVEIEFKTSSERPAFGSVQVGGIRSKCVFLFFWARWFPLCSDLFVRSWMWLRLHVYCRCILVWGGPPICDMFWMQNYVVYDLFGVCAFGPKFE